MPTYFLLYPQVKFTTVFFRSASVYGDFLQKVLNRCEMLLE